MTGPGTPLGPVGRSSDSFDGNHRHPEIADLEGQPERRLVIDDYETQTRGVRSRARASIGAIKPARGAQPDSEPG